MTFSMTLQRSLIVATCFLAPLSHAATDFLLLKPGPPGYAGSIGRVSSEGKRRQSMPAPAGCSACRGMAIDSKGNIFLGGGQDIFRWTGDAFQQVFHRDGGGGGGMAIDASGNFITADNRANAIFRISSDGSQISQVAELPRYEKMSRADYQVAIDGSGNYIVATDQGFYPTVYKVTPAGVVSQIYRETARGRAGGVAVASDGSIVFAVTTMEDSVSHLLRIDANGQPHYIAELPTACTSCAFGFTGLAIDSDTGDYILGYNYGQRVFRVTPKGVLTEMLAGQDAGRVVGIAALPATH